MNRRQPAISTARFMLTAFTAGAVFYAPTTIYAGGAAAARAAVQQTIVLQGGSTPAGGAVPPTASAGSTAGELAAAAKAQLARNQIQRQVIQSLQSSARAAALAAASGVPNGLATGGLEVASGATSGSILWSGAQLPTQTDANGRSVVIVNQTDSQAFLTWNTYNIGRETDLRYNQGGTDWIAFNKINDPSANPTQILGTLTAPGQVYIINPNGVIFGGSSQVNVRTLVASSLPINDALVERGVLNNPDTRFLFTGLTSPAGTQTNAFTPPVRNQNYGDVIVEAGAILNSPTNADKSGGRIALVGPNVTNFGTINTPDGQTILTAGLQVGFEASPDATLRGLNAYVGAVVDTHNTLAPGDRAYAGTATNAGLIDAARGAITVVGKTVNQNGVIGATTSVSRNGRIDLLAEYDAIGSGGRTGLAAFVAKSTGQVTLGADSVSEILPELASTEKTVGTKLALDSTFNVRGLAIHLDDNAALLAPAGNVSIQAGRIQVLGEGTDAVTSNFIYTDGQIYLDEGASISVAGTTGVAASVADNFIDVSLRGDELANSPLQRDGALRGQTITVDILQTGTYDGRNWVGTPLADVSGYVKLIERNIGQLTTTGGQVTLTAGSSVVLRTGASVNVSGGYTDYQSARVESTKVLSNGVLYDISKATPDLVYDGIYDGTFTPDTNTSKWGQAAADSRQTLNRLLTTAAMPGFTQGGAGGTVTITASSMALDGTLVGRSVSGERQRITPARSGGLNLIFSSQYASADSPTGYFRDSRTPPAVRFSSEAPLAAPSAFTLAADGTPLALDATRIAAVVISPELVSKQGFGRITVDNREGDITVAADAPLVLPALGELNLAGKNVEIAADITAPGGKITLSATKVSQGAINDASIDGSAPQPGSDRGRVSLASGVRLSAAGLIENDAVGTAADPAVTKGGTVAIIGNDVTLAAGSTLDVSGGVFVSAGSRFAYGNAGTISILSGRDSVITSVADGTLVFDAMLLGYSGAKGGTLVVQAPAIQIGAGTPAANATVLAAEFFQQGGFATYDIRGLGGLPEGDDFAPAVRVAAGTVLKPITDSYVASASDAAAEKFAFDVVRYDAGERAAASVSLSAVGVRTPFNPGSPVIRRGDLVVEAGSVIETDPGAKISLSGEVVRVAGQLFARGGDITVKGASNSNLLFPGSTNDAAKATLTLDSTAVLDASGVLVATPDTSGRGLRTGYMLSGGKVSLAGNIQAASGARLDVSGATAVLDLAPAYSGGPADPTGQAVVATRLDSSAGTITLAGAQQLVSQASLRAVAGGPSAQGGKLNVSSGIYTSLVGGSEPSVLEPTLMVTQMESVSPDFTRGNFSIQSLAGSGIESINLQGTVAFQGDINLSVARELRVADAGILYGDGIVNLSGARVILGTDLVTPKLADRDDVRAFYSGGQPLAVAALNGDARLNVTATQLVDLGHLNLQGYGAADINVAAGELRGSGSLGVAGDLTITAGQVYAPSAGVFTLTAYNYTSAGQTRTGSITIEGGNVVRPLPYSAGSTLNLFADTITQSGVLRAPFGQINLGWDGTGTGPIDLFTGDAVPVAKNVTLSAGSITSVSALDPVTGRSLTLPYGSYLGGLSWIDPQGRDISAQGPVAKRVAVSSAEVKTEAGSLVELDGGGDLMATRFKTGTGGKVDILADISRFAVLPGYTADYAPFAPFNQSVLGRENLGDDTGYVNSSLNVGDRIYLDGSSGLPAGHYTLLPARYAVLPGAFLVTPKSGAAPLASAAVQPDKSAFVSGYRYNSVGAAPAVAPLRTLFEVASAEVVAKRATYEKPLASVFFRDNALARTAAVPRLAADAGQVVFSATQSMSLEGALSAASGTSGLGGLVDISSPVDIRIAGPGAVANSGELLLDASNLSGFSGASVFIGGVRQADVSGTRLVLNTNNITVDNAGSPLAGAEVILAAKNNLTFAAGAELRQAGTLGGAAADVVLGTDTAGSGNGSVVRVTSDDEATFTRRSVASNSTSTLTVGAGAVLSGGSGLLFDTSGTATLAEDAFIGAESLQLASGRISLQLDNPGTLQVDAGLVLSGSVLDTLRLASSRLSLGSYSSIDVYGSGTIGSDQFAELELRTPALRGFNSGADGVTFQASTIQLTGSTAAASPAVTTASGQLTFDAKTIVFGRDNLNVRQFASTQIKATDRVLFEGTGSVVISGDVQIQAPLVTTAKAAEHSLAAGGALMVTGGTGMTPVPSSLGLGGRLALTGATGVQVETMVVLPSGYLTVTAGSGDLVIGETTATRLDVGGVVRDIQTATVATSGGSIQLAAANGDIRLGANGTVSVSAPQVGGDAGSLAISSANGVFLNEGQLLATTGADGEGGRFTADVRSLTGGSLAELDAMLDAGGFDLARTHRVRTGNVLIDGLATSAAYSVQADAGDLTVTGTIDASGATGGKIELFSQGSLTVQSGALLDASALRFDNAGKGGSIYLAAGSAVNGVANTSTLLTLAAGSILELGVDAANPVTDAANGRVTGTLHLRAPRTVAGNDLAVAPIEATVNGASLVVLEGFRVHDLTPVSGTSATINAAVRTTVLNDAATFGNADTTILGRVASGFSAAPVVVRPGIEIVNRTGDLTLSGIWDLATARYGSSPTYVQKQPGVLTLRAAGNLVFPYVSAGAGTSSATASASLSDGFSFSTPTAFPIGAFEPATAINTTFNLWWARLLPTGSQSWSYNLIAGSDISAAAPLAVLAPDSVNPASGSVLLGSGFNGFANTIDTRQSTTSGSLGVPAHYQVIRTGTGDISVSARGDVDIRNNLATIYTAGTRAADMDNFDVPNTIYRVTDTSLLGSVQFGGTSQTSPYAVQYSLMGGNVFLNAGNDIKHTLNGSPDSAKQMPGNWLYRRGNVNAETGQFDQLLRDPSSRVAGPDETLSTSWWVDFNNFFQGIGALGGGNVTLIAGDDISNVDAVVPTNARMPKGTPDAGALVELGGGDLTVRAGGDIDGGVYYVEKGMGQLTAGGDVITNYTRTTVRVADASDPRLTAPSTWLPTTLFLGKGTFNVLAGGDLTLGSVANPFMLPAGINNSYFFKTYFTTNSADNSVNAFALTGDLNLKSRTADGGGSLYDWYNRVLVRNAAAPASTLAGKNQPWLRLYETNLAPFETAFTLYPGSLSAVAAEGDLNLAGTFNLQPTSGDSLQLVAGGDINGLQVIGRNTDNNNVWASATVNVSDSRLSALPSPVAPAAISVSFPTVSSTVTGRLVSNALVNNTRLFAPLASAYAESGSYSGNIYGSLQTKQALHAAVSEHLAGTEPVRLFAGSGDISGLTLFSARETEIRAGRDISDVSFYLQNLRDADVTTITAGRDILLYNPTSALRVAAVAPGNDLLNTSIAFPGPGTGNPTAGDLQINGPGTLSVQAGRNFDLGGQADDLPPDGTAVGLSSIGNARNPFLSGNGADVRLGVGLGDGSQIDTAAFDTAFLNPASAGANATRYLPVLASLLGLSGADDQAVWTAYSNFPTGARAELTLAMFNRVLRDAGRDHNNQESAAFGTYAAGFAAIKALFAGTAWDGDLRLSSRELRTSAGGDITIYAPGGGLNLGNEIASSQTPPGIITERGGNISIFTDSDVDIGTQRIFTLRGGDVLIWSSKGNIAAGSSSTTLQSASPTRVLVDPQTGDVKTDLAGLATGGGIGVLAAIEGVPPGDVDLIAPVGTIDAGDAGIRSLGNLNLAALTVLNAANISAGGTTSGAPAASAPVIATATPSPEAGADSPAEVAAQASRGPAKVVESLSFVTIDVIGYGGGDDKEKDKDRREPGDGA